MKRICLLHVAGNAALIAAIYWWLGIGDARAAELILTVVLGLAILFAGLWLHAATFTWFRDQQPAVLWPSFRMGLRRMAPFAAVALLALLAYLILNWLDPRAYRPSISAASWLTFHLRVPVAPLRIWRAVHACFWIVRWLILPTVFLPLASAAAAHAWLGFRGVGFRPATRLYWLKCVGLTLLAFYVPAWLIHWVPEVHGFTLETVSFAVRFLIAYLLFTAAWLWLVFFSSGGRPRTAQPATTALP